MMIKEKRNLHNELLTLAEICVNRNIVFEDYIKYFNLHTFINDLESEIIGKQYEKPTIFGNFEIDPTETARYLYCCLACKSGTLPDGNKFRGMPILD